MDDARKEALSPAQSALLDKYRYLLKYGFHGSFVHGLDAKGRLIVPAAFREALGEKFYVGLTPDLKAIALYSVTEWELCFCDLMERQSRDPRMERVVRFFTKYTYKDCECDSQGRVLLPQKLRSKYLPDARDVDVSGVGNHIRITRLEDAEREEAEFEKDVPDVLAFEAEIDKHI